MKSQASSAPPITAGSATSTSVIDQETMPEIKTDITINGPPSVVRKAFFDFPSYPSWNPFLTSMETVGPSPSPGTHLKFVGGGFGSIESIIKENTPDKFNWQGTFLGKWFFMGTHQFEFLPFGDVGENGETIGCKFVQDETFTGIGAGLLFYFIGEDVKKGFISMNVALKERIEGGKVT